MSDDGGDIDINFSELIGNILSSHADTADVTGSGNGSLATQPGVEDTGDTGDSAILPGGSHDEMGNNTDSVEHLVPMMFGGGEGEDSSGTGTGGMEEEELVRVMTTAMQHLNTDWDADVNSEERGDEAMVPHNESNSVGVGEHIDMDINADATAYNTHIDADFDQEEQQREWARILQHELLQHSLEDEGEKEDISTTVPTELKQPILGAEEGNHRVDGFPAVEQEPIDQFDGDNGRTSEDEDLRRAILESLKVLNLDTEDTGSIAQKPTQEPGTGKQVTRVSAAKTKGKRKKKVEKSSTDETETSDKSEPKPAAKPESRTKAKPKKTTKRTRTKAKPTDERDTVENNNDNDNINDILDHDELVRSIIQQTLRDETTPIETSTHTIPKTHDNESSNDAETQALVEATLKAFEHELFQPLASVTKATATSTTTKKTPSKVKTTAKPSTQRMGAKEVKTTEATKKKPKSKQTKQKKQRKDKESLEFNVPGIDDEFSKVLADMVNRVVHTTLSEELPQESAPSHSRNKLKAPTRKKRASVDATTTKDASKEYPSRPLDTSLIPNVANDEALDLNRIMQNAMVLALEERDNENFDSSVIDDFNRGLGSFDVSEILSSVTEPKRIISTATEVAKESKKDNDKVKEKEKVKKKKKDKVKEKVKDKKQRKEKEKKRKKRLEKVKVSEAKVSASEKPKTRPREAPEVALTGTVGEKSNEPVQQQQQPSEKQAAEVITETPNAIVPDVNVQATLTKQKPEKSKKKQKERKVRSKTKQPSAITVQQAKEALEKMERRRKEKAEKKEREKQLFVLRRIPRPDKILKLRRARERAIRKKYKVVVTEAAKIARRRLRGQRRAEQERLREERRERRMERRRLRELESEKLEAEQRELAEIVARGPPYPPDLRLTKKGVPKKPYRRWTPEEMAQRALKAQFLDTNRVKKPRKEKVKVKKVKKLKRIPLSVLKKIPLLNFAKNGVPSRKIQLNDIEGTLSKIQLPNGLGTANNLSRADIKKLIKIQKSRYFDPTAKTVVRKEKFEFHPPWSIPDHPPLALPVARRKVKNLYKKLKGRIGNTKFTGGYNLAKESIFLNGTNKLDPSVLVPIIKTLKAVAKAKIARGFSAEDTMRHLIRIVDRTKKAIAEAIFAAMRRRHVRNISPKLPVTSTRGLRNVVDQSSLKETISKIPILSLSKIKEIQRRARIDEQSGNNVIPTHKVHRIKIEPELQMRLMLQGMNRATPPTQSTEIKQEVKPQTTDRIPVTCETGEKEVITEGVGLSDTRAVTEGSNINELVKGVTDVKNYTIPDDVSTGNGEAREYKEVSSIPPEHCVPPADESLPAATLTPGGKNAQLQPSEPMQRVNTVEGYTSTEYISLKLFGSIAYPQLTPKLDENTNDNTSRMEPKAKGPLPSPPTSSSTSSSSQLKKEDIKLLSQPALEDKTIEPKKEIITIKEEEDEETKSLGLLRKVKLLPLVAPPPRKLSSLPLVPYKPSKVDIKPVVKPLLTGNTGTSTNRDMQDDINIPSHLTKIITSTISDLIPKIEKRENSKMKEKRTDPNKVLNLDGLVPPPFFGTRPIQRIKRMPSSTSTSSAPSAIERTIAKPVVKPAKPRKLRERAAERPVLKYKFNIPDFSGIAGKKTIVLKRAKKYLNEKELVVLKRELNKERKRKWREVNVVRNWKHDLRARLRKRSNTLFGVGDSAEKEKWVESTFAIKCQESGYEDADYDKVSSSGGKDIDKGEKVSNLTDQEVLNIIGDTMGRLDIAHRIEAELNEEMMSLLEPKPSKRRKLNDGAKIVEIHAGMNNGSGLVL